MADISSIRATITHTMRMARHFWPRFMLFLFTLVLLVPVLLSSYGFALSEFIPSALVIFAVLVSLLLFYLGTLYAWSWLLSGWLRHELVPDDTPHPLSAGKYVRGLCWHQFYSILAAGLVTLITAIPFFIISGAIFVTIVDVITIYDFGDLGLLAGAFIMAIVIFYIPLFVGAIFYLRYSVGALSLTLYGQKMPLGNASAYSTEHEPAGLTRRYATYLVCYVFVMSLISMALDVVAQSLLQHEVA